jgi:hypothetical protein
MANIIALIIFTGSFIGLVFLVFRKVSVLADLPEQTEKPLENSQPIKQNLLQKTSQIKQAVFHNRGVGAMGAVMAKTTGKFKTVFASHMATPEDLQKIEKIHQEGDYWQKVEEHKAPVSVGPAKKRASRKPKMEIIQVSAPITELPPKKPRQPRKKKAE